MMASLPILFINKSSFTKKSMCKCT